MKTKIIRAIARLNVGGPAIHVILLTAGLDPERFETILISGRETEAEGNMHHLATERGVTPRIVTNLGRELHPVRDLATLWRLYRLFKREKPDIVHTHTAKAGTAGRLAAMLARVPIVVHTFHGHVLHGYFGPIKNAVFRGIERFLAKQTSVIIAVSESCRQDLIKYGVALPEHIRTIPLGLELESFSRPDFVARTQLREEWGVPQDAFLVGMIARMVPIKRHVDLFRAIPIVLQSYPDTYFLIAGDGELREELETLASELKITHRCLFAGFRHDRERVYQAIDLTVLTSANEGLPVAIIESLSAGKPVVATQVGGVPELIEEGKSGFLAEALNVESIAEGLKKALADPEATRAMGVTAQQDTLQKYSVKRLISDIENLYGELLKNS